MGQNSVNYYLAICNWKLDYEEWEWTHVTGYTAQYSLPLQPDLSTIWILPHITWGTTSLGPSFASGSTTTPTTEPINSKIFANTTTLNRQQHFIQASYDNLERQDIQIELIHSESLNGQLEIVLQYIKNPVIIVDHIVLAKETIETLGYQHQLKALFLPKINPNQAGNGIHFHISLYDKTTNLNIIATDQSNGPINNSIIRSTMITPIGGSFIEGILQHLPTLIAFTIPTTNSFRRIGPGCWTGCSADWDYDDKECPIRLITSFNGMCERFEYRVCDMTSTLYLSWSAICIAGIDGIQRQVEFRLSKADGGQRSVVDDTASGSDAIQKTVSDALTLLENNQLYQRTSSLLRAYIALDR
jgi:glutamine synthetase